MPRPPRQKDLRADFHGDDLDDSGSSRQQFGKKSKFHAQSKTQRTVDRFREVDLDKLTLGLVIQVHSLFIEVLDNDAVVWRTTVRKTVARTRETRVAVGDHVGIRQTLPQNDPPEGVIEYVEPRKTILLRARIGDDKPTPIVANADQLLMVVSLMNPRVKWGLVDRMIAAARSGGLEPIIALNKIDLAEAPEPETPEEDDDPILTDEIINAVLADDPLEDARLHLAHYRTIGVKSVETSADHDIGIAELAGLLKDRETVLAGHSGVGKSSLVSAVQPGLDIAVSEVSTFNEKGRHTTTSGRRYVLSGGGALYDTPGVKTFGLWNVSADDLEQFFPDITDDTAPPWRRASYARIRESLEPNYGN